MKPKVYFPFSDQSQKDYWSQPVFERLSALADIVRPVEPSDPWQAMPDQLDAIVLGWGALSPQIPQSAWQGVRGLRVFSILGGSASVVEGAIDALDKGITITNVAREIGEGVAETTLSLILAAQYDLITTASVYRATGSLGNDDGTVYLGRSLSGATVGMVGCGHVGRQVAALLKPFNVELLVYDPYIGDETLQEIQGTQTDLDDLLQRSDIVTLHAGWTKETEGMLGKRELDLLRPGTLVICTARLPLFDEQALAQQVQAGRLRFATDFVPFDTTIWAQAPVYSCKNLIGVPGRTCVTPQVLRSMGLRLVGDLECVLSGRQPVNRVTADWIRHTT